MGLLHLCSCRGTPWPELHVGSGYKRCRCSNGRRKRRWRWTSTLRPGQCYRWPARRCRPRGVRALLLQRYRRPTCREAFPRRGRMLWFRSWARVPGLHGTVRLGGRMTAVQVLVEKSYCPKATGAVRGPGHRASRWKHHIVARARHPVLLGLGSWLKVEHLGCHWGAWVHSWRWKPLAGPQPRQLAQRVWHLDLGTWVLERYGIGTGRRRWLVGLSGPRALALAVGSGRCQAGSSGTAGV